MTSTIAAPLPPDEQERLLALHACELMDTPPEPAFDDLTLVASRLCRTPVALVSLVDRDRQWFKSRIGIDAAETPREQAFCAHAILQRDVLVVPDTFLDERFRENPLVTGGPRIRFYAGAPLELAEGRRIGTLCVIDTVARELDSAQRDGLAALARQVVAQIELRRLASKLQAAHARQSLFEQQLQRFNLEMKALVDHRTAELKAERDRAELYFDIAASMMVVADTRGRVLRANMMAANVLGLPGSSLPGSDWFELCFPESERADARAFFDRLVTDEDESVHRFRGYVLTADGERRVVSWHTARLRDEHGTTTGLLGVGEDITARLKAEEQLQSTLTELERSNIALRQFVHVASHDLREPINSILNFAKLLKRDAGEADAVRRERFVDFIVRGGERLRMLVDDLLAFVRLDVTEARMEPVNLADLVEETRQSLTAAIARSAATIRVAPLPAIRGDRSLLGLLLQNVIDNALKFHAPGKTPEVEIDCGLVGNELHLAIRDNGIGIAPEYQERIFEAFQRLHSHAEYEGTGLGLALSRRIADMHRGRIFVESQPGNGSRFVLALPATSRIGIAVHTMPSTEIV